MIEVLAQSVPYLGNPNDKLDGLVKPFTDTAAAGVLLIVGLIFAAGLIYLALARATQSRSFAMKGFTAVAGSLLLFGIYVARAPIFGAISAIATKVGNVLQSLAS